MNNTRTLAIFAIFMTATLMVGTAGPFLTTTKTAFAANNSGNIFRKWRQTDSAKIKSVAIHNNTVTLSLSVTYVILIFLQSVVLLEPGPFLLLVY